MNIKQHNLNYERIKTMAKDIKHNMANEFNRDLSKYIKGKRPK
jgi:hypothetical protein